MTHQMLKGKNILLTGGGRGIGAGIARVLAEQGARMALTYTSRPDDAKRVASELPGQGHIVLPMNLGDSISVQQAFEEVLKNFDRLDGLVNNAGITKDQLILRMKDEDFDSVIQTNLRGTYLCSKYAIKPMLKARAGSIVNISSVVGQMGNPGQTNYAASKAGIEGFTRALALEVASRGIRVNAVAPGYIETEMTAAMTPQAQEAVKSRIPLERMGKVDDIAHAVAYLLSDGSSYVTGQVLGVNGGLYM